MSFPDLLLVKAKKILELLASFLDEILGHTTRQKVEEN